MVSSILADFYERDIRKMIEEVSLFENEEALWQTRGTVKNSAGNLALHIIGGLNHFIGATLSGSGYVRDRDAEFSKKGVGRKELTTKLEELIPMIRSTLSGLSSADLEGEFPILFDKPGSSKGFVLISLLAHLNYHLGQVNYLRRSL